MEHTHTHTHTHTHMHIVNSLMHQSPALSLLPLHIPIPSTQLTQFMHSESSAQQSCWSPVSTTALTLILWHHWAMSLCRKDAPLKLLTVWSVGYHRWWMQFIPRSTCISTVDSESWMIFCHFCGSLLRPGAAEEHLWSTEQPYLRARPSPR